MNKYFTYLLVAATLSFLMPPPATAETPAGSTIESRATLAFKANDQAVQALLPDGWKLISLPKGPFAGANLLLVFIDKHLSLDAQGKNQAPYASRTVAMVAYAVKADVKGARMFVIHGYETPPLVDPYGTSESAQIARKTSLDGFTEGIKTHQETWQVKPESGGELNLSFTYNPGKPGWKSSKATPFSGTNPEFYRIYKYKQLVDLAASKALGLEFNGEISFHASVPKFSAIFDKKEELVGVVTAPVYIREIYLP